MPERDQESAPNAVKALQRLTADRSEERETSPPAVERDVVDRVTCRAGDDQSKPGQAEVRFLPSGGSARSGTFAQSPVSGA